MTLLAKQIRNPAELKGFFSRGPLPKNKNDHNEVQGEPYKFT